jgi:hypothetical protein
VDDDAATEDIRIVQAPIRIGRVIAGLEREAVNGNAHAARELRAWLAEYPPRDDAIRAEDLDGQTRQRLMTKLLAIISEEDAALEEGSPSGDGA